MIINNIIAKRNKIHALVIVPSEELVNYWKDEVAKNIKPDSDVRIDIVTISYLQSNNLTPTCDLLVLDEMDSYYTLERSTLVLKIKHLWRLGLTATYTTKTKKEALLSYWLPVVDKIDEQEALREGYISQFTEYNVGITLDDKEYQMYKDYSKIIADNGSKFGMRGLELASRILYGDKKHGISGFDYACKYAKDMGWTANNVDPDVEMWNPRKLIGYAKHYFDAIQGRKRVLYDNEQKLDVCIKVLKAFKERKAICFAQSTEFADKVAIRYNGHYSLADNILDNNEDKVVVYHSNLQTQLLPVGKEGKIIKCGKTRLKAYAIDAIKTGKARIISTASALDKGFNVEDISLAITTSGTQNPTQYQQRKGRSVRVDMFKPETVVIVVNIYIRGTQDEKWLRQRQSNTVNSNIKWVTNLNQLLYD